MRNRYILPLLLALFAFTGYAFAQEEAGLSLRLNRDFGSSFGTQIQGTFSFRVDGPADLERVVFFIDEQAVAESSEAPFRYQFRTGNYADGLHSFHAVGYTAGGQELTSNRLQREFISSSDSGRQAMTIIVPILLLSVGGTAVAMWVANRNRKQSGSAAITGLFGGTICPNCAKPYAIHIWSINLMASRLDRCPHCRKWKFITRYPPEALQAANEAMIKAQKGETAVANPLSPEEQLRQKLDNSRFDDL